MIKKQVVDHFIKNTYKPWGIGIGGAWKSKGLKEQTERALEELGDKKNWLRAG